MSLDLQSCMGCGAAYFPARLRCHHCGSNSFDALSISEARVTVATRVHRSPEGCDFTHLVELETSPGVYLVAGATKAPTVGTLVRLDQRDDGALFIQTL